MPVKSDSPSAPVETVVAADPTTPTVAAGDPTERVRVRVETADGPVETYCSRGHAEASEDITIIDEPELANSSYESMSADALKVELTLRNHRLGTEDKPWPLSGAKAELIAQLDAGDAGIDPATYAAQKKA